MNVRMRMLCVAVFCVSNTVLAAEAPVISHGPMLGAVSENTAKIWFRSNIPAAATVTLRDVAPDSKPLVWETRTDSPTDNTAIVALDGLTPETQYQYEVRVGESTHQGAFATLGPSLKKKAVRLVFGYGYKPREDKMKPGTSIFMEMRARKPDLVMFLGDFPYTIYGRKKEIRDGAKMLRSIVGFQELTASVPTYGIYDDHDFGPNDCDGTHRYADEALAAFKEFWPNPSYGLPENKGIYCSFVVGDVHFILLDGRYQARRKQKTMLGKVQFDWLCEELQKSKSRYKVLVSGTPFGRVKGDAWAGAYYRGERDKLFRFIVEKGISGVIGISGDTHRSDIYKLPMGGKRFFYDFTSGSLARIHKVSPRTLPATMVHSYGKSGDNNMFGEVEFRPATDPDVAIIFRSFSAKNGLIYEHKLSPDEIGIQTVDQPDAPADATPPRR